MGGAVVGAAEVQPRTINAYQRLETASRRAALRSDRRPTKPKVPEVCGSRDVEWDGTVVPSSHSVEHCCARGPVSTGSSRLRARIEATGGCNSPTLTQENERTTFAGQRLLRPVHPRPRREHHRVAPSCRPRSIHRLSSLEVLRPIPQPVFPTHVLRTQSRYGLLLLQSSESHSLARCNESRVPRVGQLRSDTSRRYSECAHAQRAEALMLSVLSS